MGVVSVASRLGGIVSPIILIMVSLEGRIMVIKDIQNKGHIRKKIPLHFEVHFTITL